MRQPYIESEVHRVLPHSLMMNKSYKNADFIDLCSATFRVLTITGEGTMAVKSAAPCRCI